MKKRILFFSVCALLVIAALAYTQLLPLRSARWASLSEPEDDTVYMEYGLDLERAGLGEGDLVTTFILSQCTLIEINGINSSTGPSSSLSPDGLEDYLPMYGSGMDVTYTGGQVFISYTSSDGKEVNLTYLDDGLNDMSVYGDDGPEYEYMFGRGEVYREYGSFSDALNAIYGGWVPLLLEFLAVIFIASAIAAVAVGVSSDGEDPVGLKISVKRHGGERTPLKKRTLAVLICSAVSVISLSCLLLIPIGTVRRDISLSEEDSAVYQRYAVDLDSAGLSDGGLAADFILSKCVYSGTDVVGGSEIRNYDPSGLSDCLPLCDTIWSVSESGSYVYISYAASDGCDVTLCYDGDGLVSTAVYSSADDTLFEYPSAEGQAVLHTNFRSGSDTYGAALDNIYGGWFRSFFSRF